MLKYYTRQWPEMDGKSEKRGELWYMKDWLKKEVVEEKGKVLLAKIKELEEIGQCPTATRGTMPVRMLGAFTLSTTGSWKETFQRGNDTMDILDMVDDWANHRIRPKQFPPIFIYHAPDDINCPIEDTRKFIENCEEIWPRKYKRGRRIVLEEVTELIDKDGGDGFSTQVGHGFDQNLHEDREPFLKRTWENIWREWGWNVDDAKDARTVGEAKERAQMRRRGPDAARTPSNHQSSLKAS